jgi:hypothetical protein
VTESVQGVYLGYFPTRRAFLYEYTCSCGKRFREAAPEVSSPALCHQCYVGDAAEKERRVREYRRRKAK